jgi:hypothetical protein
MKTSLSARPAKYLQKRTPLFAAAAVLLWMIG